MNKLEGLLKEEKEKPTISELRDIAREEKKYKRKFKKRRTQKHLGSIGYDYYIINFYNKEYVKLPKIFSGIRYAEEKERKHLFNAQYSVVIDNENKEKALKALKSAGFEIHKDYDYVLFRFYKDYFSRKK